MVTLLAIIGLAYIVGSFPTGVVIGQAFRGIDIRQQGSKSMGATNVFRILGPKLGVLVLLLDLSKGALSVILISRINLGDIALAAYWLKMIVGFAAIIGHIFPVWVGFRGGKGVAVGAGVLLGLMPIETGLAILLFVIVVAITRYVSLGSMIGSVFVVISLLIEKRYLGFSQPEAYMVMALVLMITIFITHRHNILRLLKGQENKLGQKRNG